MLQRHFQFSKYEDAPELSDQLLLPNLAIGNNIFLISALVPSYVSLVVRDLASSPEIEPGHLSITFYVPGNLVRESEGIARFKDYLVSSLGSNAAAGEFVDDCLQLIEEGGLSIQVAHGPGSSKVTKGCFGIFTDPNSEDYVGFEDAKGGDYNSPIRPTRSWVPEQLEQAEKILWRTNVVLDGSRKNLYLVNWETTNKWLSHIAKWFEKQQDGEVADEGKSEIDDAWTSQEGEFFAEFVDDDDTYGWDELDPLEELAEFFASGFSVPVNENEIDDHHVPPLPEEVANVIGLASAECRCGRKFLRANGCPAITW